jgi:membrane protein implicated in regulation of membrane protease activity
MSKPAPLPCTVSDQGRRNRPGDPAAKQATPSGLELVSEMADLAAGLGILTFALAALALPALAVTAVVVVLLLIPMLLGALLAAPFLLAGRWRRSRRRRSRPTKPATARFGDREAYAGRGRRVTERPSAGVFHRRMAAARPLICCRRP